MRSISREESMPCMSTLFLWLRTHTEFSEQYAKAKLESHSALFEEIFDIADDGSNDWLEINHGKDDKDCGWKQNGEAIQRSRLRVDTRKWALSKLHPKKYGDRIHTEHSGHINDYSDLEGDDLDRKLKDMRQKLDDSERD